MEFRCEQVVLVEALSTVSRAVVGRGGALPVLSGVKFDLSGDQLLLTGSDLDLTLQVGVTVAGRTDGVAVLPARLCTDIVRSFDPGAVRFVEEGEEAHISSGRSQFSVRLLPVEDFPRLTQLAADSVTVEAAGLAEALRQVVRAASHDDARPVLTGVLMAAEGDGLRLVATDSYRLAVRDLPAVSLLQTGQSVLVPSKALSELARLLSGSSDVVVRVGPRDVAFEVGNATLTTRLIEGEFPNYRQLIPVNHPHRLTVGREPLNDALRRVKLLARETTPVRILLQPESIELSATSHDVGEAHEDLEAKYEGTDMTIAFNPEYLADGVDALEGDEITLEALDAQKPVVLRAIGSSQYLYLLMPVRVS